MNVCPDLLRPAIVPRSALQRCRKRVMLVSKHLEHCIFGQVLRTDLPGHGTGRLAETRQGVVQGLDNRRVHETSGVTPRKPRQRPTVELGKLPQEGVVDGQGSHCVAGITLPPSTAQ